MGQLIEVKLGIHAYIHYLAEGSNVPNFNSCCHLKKLRPVKFWPLGSKVISEIWRGVNPGQGLSIGEVRFWKLQTALE